MNPVRSLWQKNFKKFFCGTFAGVIMDTNYRQTSNGVKKFVKENIEIIIAVFLVFVIAVAILGGGKIKDFFSRKPLEFNEEYLITLMRDRSEEQRKIFMDKIIVVKDLLAKNQNDTDAFEIIGFMHDTLGDKEIAQKYYKEVLRSNPKSIPALNNLANIYRDRGDFGEAEGLYLKITEVEVSNIEAWRDLHDLYRYLYKSKEEQADDILLFGLSKNPDDPQILAMLATYYQDTENNKEAIKYYELLVKAMPGNEAAKKELQKLRGY